MNSKDRRRLRRALAAAQIKKHNSAYQRKESPKYSTTTARNILLSRWPWTNMKRLCVGLVGLAGFLFALTQAIGPPWPTYPDVEASQLSSSDVIDAVFNISNRSIFFAVEDLIVSCNINFATEGNAVLDGEGYIISGQKNIISPRSSSPYECPQIFNNNEAGKITSARIRFRLDFVWSFYGIRSSQKMNTEEFNYSSKLSGTDVKWAKGKPVT